MPKKMPPEIELTHWQICPCCNGGELVAFDTINHLVSFNCGSLLAVFADRSFNIETICPNSKIA